MSARGANEMWMECFEKAVTEFDGDGNDERAGMSGEWRLCSLIGVFGRGYVGLKLTFLGWEVGEGWYEKRRGMR
jgi:hypothetical protein